MKKIKSHEEVKEFAGKLVNYYCLNEKQYYYVNNENYLLKGNQLLAFGIVSKEPTYWFSFEGDISVGYNLNKLKNKNASTNMCSLQTEQIKTFAPYGIVMKIATKEEIKEIAHIIEKGEAKFSEEENWKELIGQDTHLLDC